MIVRVFLLGVALVLSLPIVRFALDEFGPETVVDRTTAEWKAREALVARAKVFVQGPTAPLDIPDLTECRYVPKPISATTPKFDCRLPNGDVVKVKYGRTPERMAEVAATRLLAALGFAADTTTMLPVLRCIGCPPYPFQTRRLAEYFFATALFDRLVDDDASRDFTWVSVERKRAGRAIEVGGFEGWDWSELKLVDEKKGGATRADVDALRLIAIFLGHWDNKSSNQRLVCEPGEGRDDPQASCRTPLLMVQDVGATFGPTKVNHAKWSATPIWADSGKCVVSMENLPYRGGQFTPIQISEAGRELLAEKLRRFSESQVRSLFEAARFPDPASGQVPGDVTMWVRTFQDKVRQIADRPACPVVPLSASQ